MSIPTTTNIYKRHIPGVIKLNELEFFSWYLDNIKENTSHMILQTISKYTFYIYKEDYLNECMELFDYMPNRI